MSKVTPIVFASDNNYIMPTAVAIKSLVENFSGNYLYIIIMTNGLISNDSKQLISKAIESKIEVRLEYISIDEKLFNGITSHIEHISLATYFRLLLPKILSDYAKCLYLDGDICVDNDIMPLLDMELNENEYIAGVKAFEIITSKLNNVKRLEILEIDSIDNYINAGVMIMNLAALRTSGIADSWLQLAKKNYPVQDQDVVNVACFKHIKILDAKYNSMPAIYRKNSRKLSCVYSEEEIAEAKNHPCIIHYADRYKPWKYVNIEKAAVWRKYYKLLTGKEKNELMKVGFTRFFDIQKGRIKYIIKLMRKL